MAGARRRGGLLQEGRQGDPDARLEDPRVPRAPEAEVPLRGGRADRWPTWGRGSTRSSPGRTRPRQFLWRVLVGDLPLRGVPRPRDLGRRGLRRPRHGVGLRLGARARSGLLDALGVAAVAERAQAEGRAVPPLVEKLLALRPQALLRDRRDDARRSSARRAWLPCPERPGVIELAAVKARGGVRKKNAGASLVDLGDGCAPRRVPLQDERPRQRHLRHAAGRGQGGARRASTPSSWATRGSSSRWAPTSCSSSSPPRRRSGTSWSASIRQFQNANMALKYADVPVVVAPFGLTLGGGCEISAPRRARAGLGRDLHGPRRGGRGRRARRRAAPRSWRCGPTTACAGVEGADPFPFLKRAFEQIAFAKVSTSGAEALRMFLTPADSLSPNPDRLIGDAKEVALGLVRAGYRPGRPRTDVPVLGRPALATFKMGIHNALRGGHISEHDALVATQVATILCGGDRAPGVGERAALPGPRARGLPLASRHEEDARAHPAHAEGRQAAPELRRRREPCAKP